MFESPEFIFLGIAIIASFIIKEALCYWVKSFKPPRDSEELKMLKVNNRLLEKSLEACSLMIAELKEIIIEQRHMHEDIQQLRDKYDER